MKTARVMNAAVLGARRENCRLLDLVFVLAGHLGWDNSEKRAANKSPRKTLEKILEIKYHTQTALEILFECIAYRIYGYPPGN